MAEYIDREALIKEIEKGIVFSGRLNSRMLHAELRGANLVIEKVKIAPAADVAPVRHGSWETNSDNPDTLICSECKCRFDMWKHDPHSYCPNCGAKMDKQER